MLKGRRLHFGQGMTEYAIILALVAISGITAFSYFGGVQRSQVAAITQELAGQESGDMLALAGTYASRARAAASRDMGLGDYYSGGGSSGGGSGGGSDTGGGGSGGGSGGGAGGGWVPPGNGFLPPGGGLFPPPDGGGMCPVSAAQQASGTMYVWAVPKEPVSQYVWAAQSEEACRVWSVHTGYPKDVPGLVSPLISTEKDVFSDRVTLALPVLSKMISVLSGDGAFLNVKDRELRDQIAQFYGLNNSNDALFPVLQSNLISLINAIDIELQAAKQDPSEVFRQKNVIGHYAMYQDGKVYLNTPFWDLTAKYQASTIVHEFSHKVGMKHEKHLTLAAAIVHVEKQRVEVLNIPPWESELRSDKLLNNINDTYFLELLFLGQF